MTHWTSTSIEDAIDRIPVGGRLVAGACCGGPSTLLRAVAARSAGRDWLLWTGLLLDDAGIYEAVASGDLRHATWHVAAAGRKLIEAGRIEYAPLRASRVERHIAAWDLDAALVRVTPPDRDGWCSVGPSASYALTAIRSAKLCIAEVDETLPRTFGGSRVHVSDLDLLVTSTEAAPIYESAAPDEVSVAIAGHIMSLLPERPVLQLGIGAVTEAVVTALADQGISGARFVGMGTDGMVELIERGLVEHTPEAPAIESPDLLGTRRLMDFAHENPAVAVHPSTVAHDPRRLAQHDRLVSVNSAIEVDLSGQVNSEVVGGRQLAGIGGSIDFVEAASLAAEGRRIIALPSTTRNGERSKIVPSIATDSVVTIPRGMIDVIVTEHGIAQLEGKTLRQRAEALIDIAAPQHREALAEAAGRALTP